MYVEIGLTELPFGQTMLEKWAELVALEDASPFPQRTITATEQITVAGFTGVYEVRDILMENGEWWPVQSIMLPIADRWIAGITIKPSNLPDYTAARQLLETLQVAPRCATRDLRATLEEVVAHEVAAKRSGDWVAFQTLMHPDADPQWRAGQQNLGAELSAVDLVRIMPRTAPQPAEWAHAAVIETYPDTQIYTTRTFKQDAFGCWRLMSPSADAVDWNNGTVMGGTIGIDVLGI
jgi:hypothetical protein